MNQDQKASMNLKSQPELVDVINPSGEIVVPEVPLTEALSRIKQDYLDTGESTLGLPVVHIWLVRSDGHSEDPVFILQERSDNNRLDKTVGGHTSSGATPDETAEREFSEEKGAGARFRVVSGLGEEALLGVDLTVEAVAQEGELVPWQLSERHDRSGDTWFKPTRTHTYIGFFDGSLDVEGGDGEATYFTEMPYSEIKSLTRTSPERFTPDVIQLIDGVAEQIKEL